MRVSYKRSLGHEDVLEQVSAVRLDLAALQYETMVLHHRMMILLNVSEANDRERNQPLISRGESTCDGMQRGADGARLLRDDRDDAELFPAGRSSQRAGMRHALASTSQPHTAL